MDEKTVVLYHGDCPDGFGGAYAAWKRFGDGAEYVALKHEKPLPVDLTSVHAIFIDFCYPQEIMDDVVAKAARVTVLDHHTGTQSIVESMPEHVFDANHSGAVIAWKYFHPGIPVPQLFKYVEEGDLYRFTMPETRPLLKYAYTFPFTFESWDALVSRFERPEERKIMEEKGATYVEYASFIARELVERAELVSFEGYTCYFTATMRMFTSDVGNQLAKKLPPLALIAHAGPDGMRISMRGDGSIDVAKIAQTYGGNGHRNAAAFSLPWGTPLPWKLIEHENPSH
jgi:uncharacterized protein